MKSSKAKCARARQHGAHRCVGLVRRVTLNTRFRARCALRSGAGRARLGLRALDSRAPRARARRALANLTRLRAGADTRRALGDARLEHILGHIGQGRALRLEHVLAHIRHRRAGRHRRLQHPLARIGFWARRARAVTATTTT
jgi:hypothetical protein